MIGKFLKGLFSSKPAAPSEDDVEPVHHEGFVIFAEPRQNDSQWQVAGRIQKTSDGETLEHIFIRADTMSSRDEAAEHTLRKAKLLIDQQGDTLFK